MSLRVSTSQIADSSVFAINQAFSRYAVAQSQLNSGKQLQKPSDNPAGLAQSLDFQEKNAELDQYGKTLSQARGFISTGEAGLNSVTTLLRQARTYAVQAASDTTSPESREALAGQIQDIINQVGAIGNTTYGARYVFGGQRTTSPPFAAAGNTFNYTGGSAATGDGDLNLDIGRGETLKTNVTGDQIIAPALKALTALRDDVSNGQIGAVSQTDLAAVDVQLNNVLSTRADFGSKINRIDDTKQRNDATKVNFTKFISDIQDTDVPSAVVQLQSAQTAYQASLQTTVRAFQTSLLDFLK